MEATSFFVGFSLLVALVLVVLAIASKHQSTSETVSGSLALASIWTIVAVAFFLV